MAAETAHGPTAGEYIGHHLQHLRSKEQVGIIDFSIINYDTLFWSILTGLLGLWLLRSVAKSVTSGVPGRLQAAVEIVLEMVDNQAKSIVHNAQSRKFVAPAGADRVHLDLPDELDGLPAGRPAAAHLGVDLRRRRSRPAPRLHARRADRRPVGHARHCRSACCACACTTTSRSRAWAAGCTSCSPRRSATSGSLYPFNFAMQMIEFLAQDRVARHAAVRQHVRGRVALHADRADGRGAASRSATGIALWLGHVLAGTGWAIFHILIVALQAFIFMMLTLVYIGQAHDAH